MFRTETTLIIGAGANREIEMPDGPELLNRIAAGFDFDRLGSEVQSRDLIAMAHIFEAVAGELGTTHAELIKAGRAIRAASFVTPSIEAILEQQSDNPLVQAAGKLAIVYYTLQAEAKSTMAPAPRAVGELPLRGSENWLFKLGQMMVSGVPRRDVENCFYKLSIIAFTYDRSIEHYLPWVAAMAFDMPIEEAQALVGLHLRIVHPLGCAGQLPWQGDDKPNVEWGLEMPDNILDLTRMIYSSGQRMKRRQFAEYLLAEMAQGRRLAFLGFDFDPIKLRMIFDEEPMDTNPDVLAALNDVPEAQQPGVARMLRHKTGVPSDDHIKLYKRTPYEILRDNSLMLES